MHTMKLFFRRLQGNLGTESSSRRSPVDSEHLHWKQDVWRWAYGESGSKQGKSKTDGEESSDVSETVDGKRYGKRRSKGDKSENDKKGNA